MTTVNEQTIEDYNEQHRLKCRDASKEGWLKVFFTYERGLYEEGTHYQLLNVENTKINTIKQAIKNHFDGWSGKGSCTISSIETGPFCENMLSKKQYLYFAGRTYKFNNLT